MRQVLFSLLAVGLISLSAIYYLNQPNLRSDTSSIKDWQFCIERSTISSCDKDDPEDRADCYNAANDSLKCYNQTSPDAAQSCIHWWIYFETAKSTDVLSDSFFKCAQDCLTYAKENNYYFKHFYQPFWLTCALPQ